MNTSDSTHQFCTFKVQDLYLGVEVMKVQEVIRYQQMTRVPLAPDVVAGLINLRGQIVTAIDLRKRLGLPPRSGERLPMNVVIRTHDGAISLLVDEIGDVLVVEDEEFECCPETVAASARELTHGTYKIKDRLLLVLDTERAVSLPMELG